MKDNFNIIAQINELMLKIEIHYPELYHNLDRAPFKFRKIGTEMDNKALCDYYNDLKEVLLRYENNRLQTA